MPCFCGTQFNIFKRKRSCFSCHCYYCNNCSGKRRKNICIRCDKIFNASKHELMEFKTKDLIFFLQSRKINFAGIVEKEELCNLIINHIRSSSYYETTTNSSSSSTPNTDFENYANSFDQIKHTCQSLFTSITDKIASDLQKTTCFNQSTQQNRREHVTTQQPMPMPRPTNPTSPQTTSSTSSFIPQQQNPGTSRATQNSVPRNSNDKPSCHLDCDCSDDEIVEISEKRQSIFDAGGPSGLHLNPPLSNAKKTKLSNSSSIESSSFEEVAVIKPANQSDDDWQFVEKTSSPIEKEEDKNLVDETNRSSSPSQVNVSDMCHSFIPNSTTQVPEVRKLIRRRSDSSLLSIKKSSSITIDTSSFNSAHCNNSSEMKKIKISCRKCGKAKSKIKDEIMKLSDQLKSSNKSEDEINAKVREFMDYLESKSQPSEMTETDESESQLLIPNAQNENLLPNSSSHDEIEANIFDENEGINVYASDTASSSQPSCSFDNVPKRFLSLDDIRSSTDLEQLNVKQLKELLMLNRVDFKGCCEKKELKERVKRLWESHLSAPPSDKLPSDDLCKICMDAPIECVFLECGHSVTCTACGKVLSECPICRSFIVRVVRIFKS